MRILVVDDAPGIGLVLGRYFERAGHQCEHLTDAFAALESLAHGPRPDVILIDLIMPRMGGRDLVLRLQELPETKGIAVVLASGYEAGQADLPPAGSFRAVVGKPFDLPELLRELELAAACVTHLS